MTESKSPIPDMPALMAMLRDGTEHLIGMARKVEFPWDPTIVDPPKLHNMYVRNISYAYTSKFASLSTSMLYAIEHDAYLTYALCGRALLEATATLYYYVHHRYKPFMEKGSLDANDFKQLIEIDDAHLRGSRFDWDSFFYRRYAILKEDAIAQLNDKKNKRKSPTISQTIMAQQVNVLTCIEKWAEETPEILIVYNLFCDLVHPNIGSNFLVASTSEGKLYFSPFRGEPAGRSIFVQSFPMILSTTYKPFGDFLFALMGTMVKDV